MSSLNFLYFIPSNKTLEKGSAEEFNGSKIKLIFMKDLRNRLQERFHMLLWEVSYEIVIYTTLVYQLHFSKM